jgi:hypothetical protein
LCCEKIGARGREWGMGSRGKKKKKKEKRRKKKEGRREWGFVK